MIAIWINAHRGLLMGIVAFSIWAFANYWYLKRDISRVRRLNRPHVWHVDMATRTSTGSKTKSNH